MFQIRVLQSVEKGPGIVVVVIGQRRIGRLEAVFRVNGVEPPRVRARIDERTEIRIVQEEGSGGSGVLHVDVVVRIVFLVVADEIFRYGGDSRFLLYFAVVDAKEDGL